MSDVFATLDGLVARLQAASWKDREAVKDELLAFAAEHNSERVREHLDSKRKGLNLELRWEIEEVVEKLTPPPAPPPPPPEAPEAPPEPPSDGKLRMSDLREVYSDPRGTVIFIDKSGKRWFLQQIDPRTGQPVMMELSPPEIEQLKVQLKGNPYVIPGRGL
jgi:hypothetical protein